MKEDITKPSVNGGNTLIGISKRSALEKERYLFDSLHPSYDQVCYQGWMDTAGNCHVSPVTFSTVRFSRQEIVIVMGN